MKTPQTDTADTASRTDPEAETMNDPHDGAAGDVLTTLCLMSLVREESLCVNGAYARSPANLA